MTEITMVVQSGSAQIAEIKSEKDGIIRLTDENGQLLPVISCTVKRSRRRASSSKKGDKTISCLTAETPSQSLNLIISQCDTVYAIDTNTRLINGVWHSVGILIKITSINVENNQYHYTVSWVNTLLTESHIQHYQIEQLMWNTAIEIIQQVESAENKVALIVDCDLDNIEQYNKRVLKIRDAKYLPENITLIYASSDNSDSILNYCIKTCDKLAKVYLDAIENDDT